MKKRIALYGTGGIGKTTVAVNTALCMARRGYRVLLVGCDPKQDTTRLLTKQPLISILERYDGPCGPSLQDGLIANPRPNLWCCEAGGPKPGVGCAGRGIAIALNALEKAGWFDRVDVVLYDVLGDVVCGGFSTPVTKGYARELYIVTSGEQASLFAANNILAGMQGLGACVRGLIYQERRFTGEDALIETFSRRVNVPVAVKIGFSERIKLCEMHDMAVSEEERAGVETAQFMALAERMLTESGPPAEIYPMDRTQLSQFIRECMPSVAGGKGGES